MPRRRSTPPRDTMTLAEAARRVGVTPGTLRRWVGRELVPQFEGEWTPSALGAVRLKGFSESTEVFIARQREGAAP